MAEEPGHRRGQQRHEQAPGLLDAVDANEIVDAVRELERELTEGSAHEAYGDALGITDAVEVEEQGIAVRDALDAVAEALRNYVLQVSATVRKKDAKSRALAQKLLAPIAEYEGSAGAKATTPGTDGTEPTDAPAAPPEAAAAPAAKKPAPVG